ncbi:MAG: DUF1648 domain-containing protein [Chthoniobacteraceae bacterium]
MRANRAAWVVFLLAFLALAVTLAVTYPELPERMASHFNGKGEPNGWMPKRSYLLFLGAVGLCVPWLLIGATRFMRSLPPNAVSVPHRDYWMAAEHREEVYGITARFGLWMATIEVLLFLVIHLCVVYANKADPVLLPMGIFWGATAGFLLIVVINVVRYYRHFRKLPERAARKRA